MTYHLPECELATGVYDDRADCICDALRACELRVHTEPLDVAYLAGLDAAEQAVASVWEKHPDSDWDDFMQEIQIAFDFIRSLGGQKDD